MLPAAGVGDTHNSKREKQYENKRKNGEIKKRLRMWFNTAILFRSFFIKTRYFNGLFLHFTALKQN